MKKTPLALSLLAAGLLLTGCATGPDPQATASPMTLATQSPMPQTTEAVEDVLLPSQTTVPDAAGEPTAADARRYAESIEDELEKLSEVDDAQVVILGDTAAVALEFDDQYQGGLDDRLREIVKERVNGVVSGVNVIEITEDPGLFSELETLGDRLDGATDMDELRSALMELINRITGKVA